MYTAAVRVGVLEGKFIINPTTKEVHVINIGIYLHHTPLGQSLYSEPVIVLY